MPVAPATWRRDLALIFVACCLFFAVGLGARPYLTPSEARYIEIPRQMLATGDWLTPRIDGVPYFEKPPLFYWLQASLMQIFGSGEFAGRLATLLLDAAMCLVTYASARMLYGERAGRLAAIVLATSIMGYGLSRVAMLDMPVSLFITVCISCFLAAQRSDDDDRKRDLYLLMYVASALAVMSKGLIGVVVPGLVIGAWIALTRRWRVIAEAHLLMGLVVFLAIAAPWHILMALKYPDFLHYYFIYEQFERYTNDEFHRTAPWWFFTAVTLVGLLPWTGLLPETLRKMKLWPLKNTEPFTLFLALWIILPLSFYSASTSKLVPYIFPIFPPLCILLGRTLADLWEQQIPVQVLRHACWFTLALFLAAGLSMHALPMIFSKVAEVLGHQAPLPEWAMIPLPVIMIALIFALLRNRNAAALISLLTMLGVVTGLTINYAAASLDRATIKPLAQALNERLQPQDMVVAYGSYWQDLPVYLNRNIAVAGWTGELSYGVTQFPETQAWIITRETFWKRCAAAQSSVYVFMRQETYDALTMPASCRLRPVGNYGKTVLLERQTP